MFLLESFMRPSIHPSFYLSIMPFLPLSFFPSYFYLSIHPTLLPFLLLSCLLSSLSSSIYLSIIQQECLLYKTLQS